MKTVNELFGMGLKDLLLEYKSASSKGYSDNGIIDDQYASYADDIWYVIGEYGFTCEYDDLEKFLECPESESDSLAEMLYKQSCMF